MSSDQADDLLSCPICFEIYRDPVLLGACGHSYCAQCVRSLPRPLRCPTCRKEFKENAVLPNFALRALLRERETAGGGAAASALLVGTSAAEVRRPSGTLPGRPPAGPLLEREEQPMLLNSARTERASLDTVLSLGVPAGLAGLLLEEDASIALRIFLLDNSGSTGHPDGCVMEERPDGTVLKRACTRWDEIKQLSLMQASWNSRLGTPSEFVLLNPAARGEHLEPGIDFVRVNGNNDAQLAALRRMLGSTTPRGTTPLSDRLRKIYARIAPEARNLALAGQKVVLVIVTDGLPTSGYHQTSGPEQQRELASQLRRIGADLPVHLVVRLCTSEDEVVEFYNSIDEEVELQLEVIDDMESEAREIHRSGNRWLTYSPLLHRIREGGTFMKLFDLLDERALTPMEICLFCQLLLRQLTEHAPLPSEPHEFCRVVQQRVRELPEVYDPLRQRMMPPVLPEEVEYAVLPTRLKRICLNGVQGGCTLQ